MKSFKVMALAFITLFLSSNIYAQGNQAAGSKLLSGYYDVKNALIEGSSAGVKAKAKDFLAAVNAFPGGQLTGNDKAVWTKYIDKLQFDGRHISESDNIVHQREHFVSLSQNFYEVVKELKLNATPVYKDYCPMKKAYWLSETAVIKNPYFGSQMPGCGEVKETIK